MLIVNPTLFIFSEELITAVFTLLVSLFVSEV